MAQKKVKQTKPVKTKKGPLAKQLIPLDPITALDLLKKKLPKTLDAETRAAFSEIQKTIKQPGGKNIKPQVAAKPEAQRPAWQARSDRGGSGYFDFLDLIRRLLLVHDLLFLSRQITYHISTSADLPRAFANSDQVHFVISKLIEHMVRRASRNTQISIKIKKTTLRNGPGIEISFSCLDRHLGDTDREAFLAGLFGGKGDDVSGVALSDCRQIASREHGQLWVDFSKSYHPVYHLVLPAFEIAAQNDTGPQQTFKYDVEILNYANLRKRFGIKKSSSLVSQVEHYIRSLVRYPIDIVMALGTHGVITTIYETQRGAAQSVASRISSRLGSEKFRIGKMPVDISFSYRLSPLSQKD